MPLTCAAARCAQVSLNGLHVTTGMGRAPLFDGDTKSTLASNITLHTGNISVLSLVTAVSRLDAVWTHFQCFHRLFRAFLARLLVLITVLWWSVQEKSVHVWICGRLRSLAPASLSHSWRSWDSLRTRFKANRNI